MRISTVTKNNIQRYRELILPYVYDEFKDALDETGTEYLAIAAVLQPKDPGYERNKAVSVLVIQPEPTGDLTIISIYTLPEYRRRGYATSLIDAAIKAARAMFIWEEDETEDIVILKTIYRLPYDILKVYEAFLIKNHFTQFILLEEDLTGEDGSLDVWSAECHLKFYRNQVTSDA